MNLFITDPDPRTAASQLDNKRVGKQLMECNQMMSLAVKCHSDDWEKLVASDGLTRGFSHLNHPVSIWVRETIGNYDWVLAYAEALRDEFQYRFAKHHASAERLPILRAKRLCLPAGNLLPFQNSAKHEGMGLDFTYLPVPYSYRAYLKERWRTDKMPVRFTGREQPAWVSTV